MVLSKCAPELRVCGTKSRKGKGKPCVPPGDLSLFIDHKSPEVSVTLSIQRKLQEYEYGFKAGLTRTCSGMMY